MQLVHPVVLGRPTGLFPFALASKAYNLISFNLHYFAFLWSCSLGLFKKILFFVKFNSSAQQIVRLVIEIPHTKFQFIWSAGRGGHAI